MKLVGGSSRKVCPADNVSSAAQRGTRRRLQHAVMLVMLTTKKPTVTAPERQQDVALEAPTYPGQFLGQSQNSAICCGVLKVGIIQCIACGCTSRR